MPSIVRVISLIILAFVALFSGCSAPRIKVDVVDYSNAKTGSQPSIIIALTNLSCLSIQRIDRIEIEQISATWCSRLRRADRAVLASGRGEHIEVIRPESRGRWRVILFSCSNWRERLDNDFTRALHLSFLYATYHGVYTDWIDD
jgi:hypothetical protein